jgi:hypothetical protein
LKRLEKLVGLLTLSVTIWVSYCISSASIDKEPQNQGNRIPLQLTIEVNGDRIDFTLTNSGNQPIAYFDAWQENLGLPGGAWIEAKDAQGKSVTTTSVTPTGQWSPMVYNSQATVIPVEKLALLAPRSSRSATGSIWGSLEAMRKLQVNSAPAATFKVGCRVYLDRELLTALTCETPWLSYPLQK